MRLSGSCHFKQREPLPEKVAWKMPQLSLIQLFGAYKREGDEEVAGEISVEVRLELLDGRCLGVVKVGGLVQ